MFLLATLTVAVSSAVASAVVSAVASAVASALAVAFALLVALALPVAWALAVASAVAALNDLKIHLLYYYNTDLCERWFYLVHLSFIFSTVNLVSRAKVLVMNL